MSVDQHFFSRENFDYIKDAIVKEIKNRYKYNMENQIDEDIFKVMQYIFSKVGNTPPINIDLNQYLNMMNQKVYELIINRMQSRLENNPEDMLEMRRRERSHLPLPAPEGQETVQSHMQLRGVEEIDGDRVIEEAPLIGHEVESENIDDIVNSLHAQTGMNWLPEPDPVSSESQVPAPSRAPDQVDIPSRARENITKYLTIDSRFRDMATYNNANRFTVRFPQEIDLVSLSCVDVICPDNSRKQQPYLILKIDQFNGQYYEDDIFAKLVPTGVPNSYRPSIEEGIKFSFPQRLQEFTFQLLTPTRQPYLIKDLIVVNKLEKALNGNVQVSLKDVITLEEGDSVSFLQFLDKHIIEIPSQEFTYRMQSDSTAWVYGNFGEVAPKNGDLVKLITKESEESVYYNVLDGKDRGAMFIEGVKEETLENLDRCEFICYSEDERYSEGLYDNRAHIVTKVHKERKGIDKFEIDFKYDELADRDHLGDRKIIIEHLQVSYTFKMQIRI